MKKNKFKLFGIIALVAIMGFTFAACSKKDGGSAGGDKVKTNPESDFEASPIDGGKSVEITDYVGDIWEVGIPSKIQNLPVTSIGQRAFKDKKLIKVSIPNSVTTIGYEAFANNQLTSVNIPNSVTTIGEGAFEGNQLTSVTIPNGVTAIGHRAFSSNQLTSVTIGNSVTEIGIYAFSNNQLTSVIIPDNVTTIGRNVFAENKNDITIPDRLAFQFDSTKGIITDYFGSGGSVTIPATINSKAVTEIGANAFANKQLTSVTIPNSVTKIGGAAFYNNQLTSVTIGVNVSIPDSVLTFFNGFEANYNSNGKAAGTYTRPNTNSTTWTKQ